MPDLRPLLAILLSILLAACHSEPSPAPLQPGSCGTSFQLVALEPLNIEPDLGQAQALLAFSAPPDLAALADKARFRLQGSLVEPLTLEPLPEDPARIRVSLPLDRQEWLDLPATRLALHLDDGLPCATDPQLLAPPVRLQAELLPQIPPVALRSLLVHEGKDGHYLEVLCEDFAVESRFRRYADGARRRVSERCMPDVQAGGGLRIEPPVTVELAATRGGFLVYGPFERGEHRLVLEQATPTLDGGRFHRQASLDFEIPLLEPRIAFISQGRYLPRSALRRLGLRHRNVPGLRLRVRHVPPENLVWWLSGRETTTRRTSDLLADELIPLQLVEDEERELWLDLDQHLPGARNGLYELTAEALDPEDPEGAWGRWNQQTEVAARVLLTDLQLVAKRAATKPGETWSSQVLVWALDAHGAGLLQGVDVQLVRPSGKAMGRCQTDARGHCRIQVRRDEVDTEPPFALLARYGSDTSFLEFADLELEARGDVHGQPFLAGGALRAAAWTDRGVYRPGETVRLAALLRGDDDLAPEEGLPVTLLMRDPRGQELRRLTLQSNAAGMLTADLPLRDFARTGRYRAVLEVAEQELGRVSFMVEEIAPERMEVRLAAESSQLLPDQEAELQLAARWLFGSPAAGSKLELSCELARSSFEPARNNDYRYGPVGMGDDAHWSPELARHSATLDPNGQADLRCPAAASLGALPGPARLNIRAAVFEGASGRSSRGRASVEVHPERFYIGLKTRNSTVQAGQPVRVEGLLTDWQGEALAEAEEQVQVSILRLEREYSWTWRERSQDFRQRRWTRQALEQELELEPQGGALSFSFTPSENAWGYLVRASAASARSELLLRGENRGWQASGLYHTPEPGRPGWLEVDAPEEARVGQRLPVSVQVPQPGWLLLTLETWQVLQHQWLRVQPGEQHWSFALRDFSPNVYVSALLVQDPHQLSQESYLPGRSQGIASVRVRPEPFAGSLQLQVPDELRPDSTLPVALRFSGGKGPAYVTVAAVDEGLLSLTGHATPDPLADLFQPRSLGVETFETVGWSLQLPSAAATRAAGGDAAGRGRRVQAVKPVALWSGMVQLPDSGRATVPLQVPCYRGALRVMAVAASAQRVGRAEARVTVREPLLLQVSAPRFMLQGDRARVPVELTNLSGSAQRVAVSMRAEAADGEQSPVALQGSSQQVVDLASEQRVSLPFNLDAQASQGAARLLVRAEAASLASSAQLDLPLASPLPQERHLLRLPLQPGELALDELLQGWQPGSDRSQLRLSANPHADVLAQLQDLLRYPHGCLEQTTSKTRVLLAMGHLLQDAAPELAQQMPSDAWIQAGLERVLTMRTHRGGFAYWPGGREPSPWASAYALHMLLDARDAGYAVPAEAIEGGMRYLKRLLDSDSRSIRAYAHYVLARAGQGQPAKALSELKRRAPDRQSVYLLQAAVHISGDHRYQEQLHDLAAFSAPSERRSYRGFSSDLSERGLVLSCFREIFGQHAAGLDLADAVAAGLRRAGSGRATTQELAWGLTGLAAGLDEESPSLPPMVLRLGERQVAPVQPGRWFLAGAAGQGRLVLESPRQQAQALYLVASCRGARLDGAQPWSQGASLQRELLDAHGEPLDPQALEVGNLLYVRLTLASQAERLPNVALTDRLPAGWEIENPALSGRSLPDWADTGRLWQVEHRNLRDDRLEAFGTLELEQRQLIYALRAVTAGRFAHPGALLEAMYDPRVRARTAAGQVAITPRQGAERL